MTTEETIQEQIKSNSILLYMKGSPQLPQCGFSANASAILRTYGKPLAHFDVLSDPEVRQGIKDFSNWPTIPQLYVKGEFVGGCDIVREMYASGELAQHLKDKGVAVAA